MKGNHDRVIAVDVPCCGRKSSKIVLQMLSDMEK